MLWKYQPSILNQVSQNIMLRKRNEWSISSNQHKIAVTCDSIDATMQNNSVVMILVVDDDDDDDDQ